MKTGRVSAPYTVITAALAVCMGVGALLWLHVVGQVSELLRPWPAAVNRDLLPNELASATDIELLTADGLKLKGWFLPGSRRGVIILTHGHGADRTQMIPEAVILAKQGYSVLLFDWRAHGESGGTRSTRGDLERLDLQAAVDFLSSRPEALGKIGVLGFSRGGAVAIAVAAADSRIRAVVAQAASPNITEGLLNDIAGPSALIRWPALWAARRAGINVEVSAEEVVGRIAPRPILLIHGTADSAAPPQWAQRLYSAASEPKELWLVDGAGHGDYSAVTGSRYESRLVSFFGHALPD